MLRLRETIAAAVRSEVTVGCKIAEIECLVARYCVRGRFLLLSFCDGEIVEYPFSIKLPGNTRSLCVDEDGSMLLLGVRSTCLLLSEDGTEMPGFMAAEFQYKPWIVYHTATKTLITTVTENVVGGVGVGCKIATVDPKTCKTRSIAEWPLSLHGYFRKPYFDRFSDHVVINTCVTAQDSTHASICWPDGRLVEQRRFAGSYRTIFDLGQGRLALECDTHLAIVDRGTDVISRLLYKPHGTSCYDAVSQQVITLTTWPRPQHLHFQDVFDQSPSRSVAIADTVSGVFTELMVVARSDGLRLLYIKRDERLVVYDLASL